MSSITTRRFPPTNLVMMESLPVEILMEIFSYFCFHCQHRELFPNADVGEVRGDKKVLAYLCRTSKAMCAIAQPILYHYYATGNSGVETRLYKGHDKMNNRPSEPDLLPQFINTVAQRPDLASQVTTMHIVQGDFVSGFKNQMRTIDSLNKFSAAGNILVIPYPPDDQRFRNDGGWSAWSWGVLHIWLATLAVGLTPRLERLLLTIDCTAPDWPLDFSRLKLPSLRTLGLVGFKSDCHLNKLKALFAAAPNLETIYACDVEAWFKFASKYELAPSILRKLVISNLFLVSLACWLPCVPRLEELEYYWDGEKEYSHADLIPMWIEPPSVSIPPLRPLRQFDNLEELSISCFSIYWEHEPDDKNRLVMCLSLPRMRRAISHCLRRS
ncbi:hypothetical protein F4677DRAFT_402601 [Hypoxylon crocopeplum]|nr:hypothetical protein F4677DRAFT_402601 [Hypoxylon crocopeplum]